MAGLRATLAQLHRLRRKFENLFAAARSKSVGEAARPGARLRELKAFGANPGNLRAFVYVPDAAPRLPPLVVALHGCTQTADDFDNGSGWSKLADQLGFVVLYPEQQPANNAQNCFSWFLPGDIVRDAGEALSIRQMIEQTMVRFPIDRQRVFITGLSAGGAMASVMLASYPEVFAGGAIIAGLPYGCAASLKEALAAMSVEREHAQPLLGDRVRSASPHRGPWPRISVWHGSADPIVRPSNAEDILGQWINVHGLPASPSHTEKIAGHSHRVWRDGADQAVIEAFTLNGMSHGVPIEPAKGCGAAGPFFLDVGLSATHCIAGFWGLGADRGDARGRAGARGPAATPMGPPPVLLATRSLNPAEAPGVMPERETHPPGAASTIAAAFKAAGLPVLEVAPEPGTRTIDPGLMIAMALKAAGLLR
jgi:poly(hydroxyalkanoate) depolymerase family esterase